MSTSVSSSVSTSVSSSVSTSELSAKKEKKQKKEINNIYINKTKTEGAAAAVIKAYEANIGNISPFVYDKLLAWLDIVDESLVLYAIEQAVSNGKCTLSYIEAILNNHFKNGRKTRAEAEKASCLRSVKTDKPKSRYDYDEIERRTFLNVTKGAGT